MDINVKHPTDRPNFCVVTMNKLTVWFSYETPIAFHHPDFGTVARENDWGPTTVKHLGMVDVDKADRLPGVLFLARLDMALVTGAVR